MYIKAIIGTVAVSLALVATTEAEAKGCLKGAAVGAVGGHFVGSGHSVLGAAGGCAVGHHMANKKDKEQQQAAPAQQQPAQAPAQQPATN